MALLKEEKNKIVKEFQNNDTDACNFLRTIVELSQKDIS